MTRERKRTGRLGEEVAVRYLQNNGYSILERNWTCRLGELDIVAQKGDLIIFVEVKTRTGRASSYGIPQESVNRRKQSKIRRLAGHYLMTLTNPDRPLRFDVISVWLMDPPAQHRLEHLQNAF